ncbi:hypothetical protein [Pyrococcus abyssi]|uniref:ATPase n=1 Tax=Pyrococcus abyssi (strain GE5 / Orsay) TaxID=272844 RepID=Q9UXY9_PYRAB|nr:hypothetical protein [Pyrococcus abyssi]CAB50623.1 Hypothetical protein PAB1127 [Pyrococcus abyssi GE5]CCE71190.1 TPA: hypothetical protein PAB1127 [Pyrococcus abyssi GE5]
MLPRARGFVEEFRLKASLRALERVKEFIEPKAYERLRDLVECRLTGKEFERDKINVKIAVAYSGGSDSSATVKILRWAGFDVVPITARLPHISKEKLREETLFVEVPGYLEEMEKLIEKRAPICGRCHSMVMRAVEEKVRELKIRILATGDMLSIGSGSIYEKENLVILNLPAFLSLNKVDLLSILGWEDYEFKYGCPLWREAVKRVPIMKRFAIQRVLRELRTGAINEDIAKKLIFDILRA